MQGPLRRTRTTQNTLSSLSSDVSSPSSPAVKRMGLNSEIPSSSLYLQGLSGSSSFPSSIPRFQRQASSLSCSTLSVDSFTVEQQTVLENPSNLVQWALLLALILQIPNLLDEIHLIVDLHYHSFPLLVFLGTFPLFTRRKRSKKNPEDSNALLLSKSRVSLLVPETLSVDFSEGDEWGHFADIDASTMTLEQDLKLAGPPSCQMTLTTLEEAEEEEEEE